MVRNDRLKIGCNGLQPFVRDGTAGAIQGTICAGNASVPDVTTHFPGPAGKARFGSPLVLLLLSGNVVCHSLHGGGTVVGFFGVGTEQSG